MSNHPQSIKKETHFDLPKKIGDYLSFLLYFVIWQLHHRRSSLAPKVNFRKIPVHLTGRPPLPRLFWLNYQLTQLFINIFWLNNHLSQLITSYLPHLALLKGNFADFIVFTRPRKPANFNGGNRWSAHSESRVAEENNLFLILRMDGIE